MGKQTIKNKSSKKELSFTGKRVLGENKSKFIVQSNDSENTTDQMMQILGSELSSHNVQNTIQNNVQNTIQPVESNINQNRIKSLLGSIDNQQSMFQNIDPPEQSMQSYQQPMQQMQSYQQPMQQMQPYQQPMQQPFNGNDMNMQMNNQFAGVPADINDDMVNTFAPVHNMNTNNLLSAQQIAQNMGNIANLSKLSEMPSYGSSNQSLFDNASVSHQSNFNADKFKNMASLNQMTML